MNPLYLGHGPPEYAHDVYVRDRIMYSSELWLGSLTIYDASNPAQIKWLGSQETPMEFTHNAWISDDGSSIFTTDERANGFIASYDISDYQNISELDRFRPAKTLGQEVIPHNVHVKDDYLVISYYTDGCIVVDASRPGNLIEVGNYDSFTGESGGYNGAWGVYPFLKSGLILISDRQSGLIVVEPRYTRAAYFEGVVLDGSSREPILNATIEIISNNR
jgi:hypothetical protein